MASEIRVDKITSLSGVGTITPSPTGIDISGITTVATLKATTGIVTTLTAVSSAKVGSGVTLSPDGDIFATGVTTSTTFVGALTGNVTGNISGGTVAGSTGTFTSHVSLGDSDELRLGAGNDLKLYHNGNNSFIEDAGTGDFYIRGADNVRIQSYSDNEDMAKFIKDGAVELYYDNSKKLQTQSGGVRVFGDLENHDDDFVAKDNCKFVAGNSEDVQLYHDGSNSYLAETGTGNLIISGSAGVYIKKHSHDETMAAFLHDAEVQLYHNNTLVCQTSANGLAFPSGKGIDFSATADGHGTPSELLDDYEEGTYTLNIPSNGGGATITAHRANYTKIGNLVRISGSFNITSTNGTNNNHARFSVPFTSSVSSYYVAHGNTIVGPGYSGDELSATIENSAPYMIFNTSVGMSIRSFSQLGTNRFDFDVVYRI